MHCRLALVFAAASAVCAQSDCAESNCDTEDVSSLMSVQLLQTDRHISKTKAADSEHHLAGIKRDYSDLLGGHHDAAHSHNKNQNQKKQTPEEEAIEEAGEAAEEAAVDHAAATGVGANADDDIYAFIAALIANSVTIVGCIAVFMALRGQYPQIYSNNVSPGSAPLWPEGTIPEGMFGWASAAWYTTTDASAEKIGLDNALLLQFTEVCMKILLIIGIPLVFIEGPLNMFFGGNAAGLDYMSYLSFGNVEVGHPWLYHVHACFVWFVVLTVQTQIYAAQRRFLQQRYNWLKSLPDQRANTLLVEGIPEKHRSDSAIKAFFEKMMSPGSVKSAACVKDTTELCKKVAEKDALELQLAEAEGGDAPDSSKIDSLKKDISKTKDEMKQLQNDVKKQASQMVANTDGEQVPDPINLSKAFVEFKQARQAQICLNLQFSSDSSVWVTSVPPEPRDMLWNDLTADPTVQAARDVIGYALVVGLYFAYMPLVIGISQVSAAVDMGPMQSTWEGLAPTMGLQIMVAFLPTILLLIFRSFFILKADAWSQTRLQKWYFWFQIVFVILITAIGDSVVEFTTTIFTDPIAVFGMLAETMPHATHFYMNFLVLQWTTHAMNLLRYVPLSKFLGFRNIFEEEEARAKAEPEDQDYYGLGSRSARFTINMVIGIVYSTLSPTVALLACMNFFCCRLFYGYLIPFAETKKPDLGGVFWVTSLEHVFIGNCIYCVLMTGVLFGRAPTAIPGVAVAPTIFYVLWSLGRFKEAFAWENLPFEVVAEPSDVKKRAMAGEYIQPELIK
jgi:hypothetical protein